MIFKQSPLKTFMLCLCFLTSVSFACDNELAKQKLKEISWLTEDYPPYNYINNQGQLVGIFTESLALIYQTLGIELQVEKIRLLPWARLYHNMQYYSGYGAFSMMKTPERDALFTLIHLPFETKTSIMVLANRREELAAKELDALTIAVVRKDIGQQLLIDQGIEATLVETSSAMSMLQMLALERVDAIAYAEEVAYFQSHKVKLKSSRLVPIHVLNDQAIPSFVFHAEAPECVTKLMRDTIESLAKTGRFEPILSKYKN